MSEGYRISQEEWASGRAVIDGSSITLGDDYVSVDNDPDGAPESMAYMETPAVRFVTSAFALHSQPFGFTWADFDLVEDQAAFTRLNTRADVNPGASAADVAILTRRAENLETLASRIAALLPPRETT